MKPIILIIISIPVTLFFQSCEIVSHDSDDFDSFVTNEKSSYYRSLSTLNDVFEASAATRKLISLTITDHDTGSSTTRYDCSDPGRSCDVGEPAPNPNQPRKLLEIPNDQSVFDYLQENELEYSSIYPVLFDSIVVSLVEAEYIDIEYQNGFLTIVDQSNLEPIFGYEIEQSALVSKPKTELRKGVINTQTKIFECIDPGTNCSVKVDNESELVTEVNFIQDGFSGLNITQLLWEENYILYKDDIKYTLMPPDTLTNEILYFVY